MSTPPLDGMTAAGFEPVRDAFADNFGNHPELGAAVCVVVGGEVVVDLWGGHVDTERTRPWERDTIVNVFSATKGWVATVAHRLAARGELDLDAPVATYWPEFGAAGKGQIPVRSLLDHSAGLAAVREPLPPGSLYDWDAMCAALAAEEPWWEPGTAHGYHAVTFGWLVGEVLHRVSGRPIGQLLHDELAGPFSLDLQIGAAAADDGRIAEVPPTIVPASAADNPVAKAVTDPTSLTALAFANPADLMEPGVANTERWRRAEIPASNGHANARAIGRLYGALANGGVIDGEVLLSAEAVDAAAAEHRRGPDQVLGAETAFAAGYMLRSELRPFGRNAACFGHPGAGGSLGFADREAGLGFGYTPNQTIASMMGGDPRWGPLMDAAYSCLG